MSTTRQQVYNLANDLAKKAQKEGIPHDRLAIEPGSGEDDYLHGLLNKVEDDRAHHEAEKLRQRIETVKLNLLNPHQTFGEQLIKDLADEIDPYEIHDGELVRKSDGKPVIL